MLRCAGQPISDDIVRIRPGNVRVVEQAAPGILDRCVDIAIANPQLQHIGQIPDRLELEPVIVRLVEVQEAGRIQPGGGIHDAERHLGVLEDIVECGDIQGQRIDRRELPADFDRIHRFLVDLIIGREAVETKAAGFQAARIAQIHHILLVELVLPREPPGKTVPAPLHGARGRTCQAWISDRNSRVIEGLGKSAATGRRRRCGTEGAESCGGEGCRLIDDQPVDLGAPLLVEGIAQAGGQRELVRHLVIQLAESSVTIDRQVARLEIVIPARIGIGGGEIAERRGRRGRPAEAERARLADHCGESVSPVHGPCADRLVEILMVPVEAADPLQRILVIRRKGDLVGEIVLVLDVQVLRPTRDGIRRGRAHRRRQELA